MSEGTDRYLKEAIGPCLRGLLQSCANERPPDVRAFLVDKLQDQIDYEHPTCTCMKNVFYQEPPTSLQLALKQADFTPAWLSKVLNANITKLGSTKLCSEGQVGVTVLCLGIEYGSKAEAASRPSSIAVKMHGPSPSQRQSMGEAEFYSKELYVYKHMADAIPVEMPNVYAILFDSSQGFDKCKNFNLVMNNLNEDYEPYQLTTLDKVPTTTEWKGIFREVTKMHAQWWESPEILRPPFICKPKGPRSRGRRSSITFENSPTAFALPQAEEDIMYRYGSVHDDWRVFLVNRLPDTVHDFDNMGLSLLAGNGGKDGPVLIRQCMDRLQSAPLTLIHGDLNPGNIWKAKSGGLPAVADWQVTKAGPAAWDYVSPQLGIELGPPMNTIYMDQINAGYELLCERLPDLQKRYPLASFLDHIKCCHILFYSLAWCICHNSIVTSIRNGLMDPDKAEFTLHHFVAATMRRAAACAAALNMDEFVVELLKEARSSQ